MTLAEVLFALAIRTSESSQGELLNMENREILTTREGKIYITQHWSEVLDEILADSSGSVEKSEEELLNLATQIQECFPKQKMRDVYGRETSFYYRCNKTEIKRALKRFYENSSCKTATDEEIIDATKRYVASFKGNYSGKMRLAKYFIWKNDVKPGADGQNHVEAKSDLETFIENKESEEEVVNNDDWTVQAI